MALIREGMNAEIFGDLFKNKWMDMIKEDNPILGAVNTLHLLSDTHIGGFAYQGKSITSIIFDELKGPAWLSGSLSQVRQFKDPMFPDADTVVVCEKEDKRNPLNPNPAAGSRDVYAVYVGKNRVGRAHPSLKQAEAFAKAAHKSAIARIRKATLDDPDYGRF